MLLWSDGLPYRLFFLIAALFLGACSHQAVENPAPGLEDNQKLSIEAIFKAVARALRMACGSDPRALDMLPSSKGKIGA